MSDAQNNNHNTFINKQIVLFIFTPIAAVLLLGLGYYIGLQAAYASIRSIANDIEHQKAFTECLVERWKTNPNVYTHPPLNPPKPTIN